MGLRMFLARKRRGRDPELLSFSLDLIANQLRSAPYSRDGSLGGIARTWAGWNGGEGSFIELHKP